MNPQKVLDLPLSHMKTIAKFVIRLHDLISASSTGRTFLVVQFVASETHTRLIQHLSI
jgi:hypothetical protein